MNNAKRVFYDKLFPKKEEIKLQNLLIDDESISYITNPYDSEKISKMIAEFMETKYKQAGKEEGAQKPSTTVARPDLQELRTSSFDSLHSKQVSGFLIVAARELKKQL